MKDTKAIRICPLMSSAEKWAYCLREDCALWMTDGDICAIMTIAYRLKYGVDISGVIRIER